MAFSENPLLAMDQDPLRISMKKEDWYPCDNFAVDQSNIQMAQVKIKEEDPLALPEVKTELQDPLALSPQVKSEIKSEPVLSDLWIDESYPSPATEQSRIMVGVETHGNPVVKSHLEKSRTAFGVSCRISQVDTSHLEQSRTIFDVAPFDNPVATLHPEKSRMLDDVHCLDNPFLSPHPEQSRTLVGVASTDKAVATSHPETITLDNLACQSISVAMLPTEQPPGLSGAAPHNNSVIVLSHQSRTMESYATNINSVVISSPEKSIISPDIERLRNSGHASSPQSSRPELFVEKTFDEELNHVGCIIFRPTGGQVAEFTIKNAEDIVHLLNSVPTEGSASVSLDLNVVRNCNAVPEILSKETVVKNREGNSGVVAAVQTGNAVVNTTMESCPDTPSDRETREDTANKTWGGIYKYIGEDLQALDLHWKRAGMGDFICQICNYRLSRMDRMRNHIRAHLNSRPFVCVLCDASFHDRSSAGSHKNVHNPRFQCGVCGRQYNDSQCFKDHTANFHSGLRPYKCKKCGTTYQSKVCLHTHNKLSHCTGLLVPHMCEECGKLFKNRGKLLRHVGYMHDPAGLKMRKCTVCNKILKSKSLRAHMIFHSNLRLTCDICSKLFASRDGIRIHIHTVHADGKFKCTECEKVYKTVTALKDHIASHRGKTYCCPICAKTFSSRANLDTHKFVHAEKNFVCAVCGAKFNRNDNMKSHVKRMHTDKKGGTKKRVASVFSCGVCEKSFGTNKLMKDHMVSHDARYCTCDFCSKSYLSKKRLSNHIISVHLTSNSNTPTGN